MHNTSVLCTQYHTQHLFLFVSDTNKPLARAKKTFGLLKPCQYPRPLWNQRPRWREPAIHARWLQRASSYGSSKCFQDLSGLLGFFNIFWLLVLFSVFGFDCLCHMSGQVCQIYYRMVQQLRLQHKHSHHSQKNPCSISSPRTYCNDLSSSRLQSKLYFLPEALKRGNPFSGHLQIHPLFAWIRLSPFSSAHELPKPAASWLLRLHSVPQPLPVRRLHQLGQRSSRSSLPFCHWCLPPAWRQVYAVLPQVEARRHHRPLIHLGAALKARNLQKSETL